MNAEMLTEMFEPDDITLQEIKTFRDDLLILIDKHLAKTGISIPKSSPQRVSLSFGYASYFRQAAEVMETSASVAALLLIRHKQTGE